MALNPDQNSSSQQKADDENNILDLSPTGQSVPRDRNRPQASTEMGPETREVSEIRRARDNGDSL